MNCTKTLVAVVALSTGFSALAATSYSPLAGRWQGTITTNQRDATGKGSPTADATGTPVVIQLTESGNALTGSSTVGGSKETWNISGDQYVWKDDMVTVTTKAILGSDVPDWMKKEAGINPTDTFYAFKFTTCTVNKTSKPCEVGKDIPDGMDKTGIYLFKVQGDQLHSNVYYTYSTGGKRVLEVSLNRTK